MSVTHKCSLPLHANPARIDPCVTRNWFALPLSKTVIGVWKVLPDCSAKQLPIELNGHLREITALVFGSRSIRYLASACRDKILLWDLLSENEGQINSHLFFSKPGDVTIMGINNTDDLIAAGVNENILIVTAGEKHPLAIFESHRGRITGLNFCPHFSATLVSLSDDGSFCVWDVKEMILLHQSRIISVAPLISMTMSWKNPHIAIGTADGKLKIFDLTDNNDFRQLANKDIAVSIQKYLEKITTEDKSKAARPTVLTSKGKQANFDSKHKESFSTVQSSESILSVQYMYFAQESVDHSSDNLCIKTSSGVGDILDERPPSICVITTSAMLQINSRTLEILEFVNLQKPISSYSFNQSKTVGTIAYAGLGQVGSESMLAVVGTLFEGQINVLQWNLRDRKTQNNSEETNVIGKPAILDDDDDTLSIIPNSVVESSSPLNSEMLPPVISNPITKGDVATGKRKPQSVMNQPLIFKSKIKSSGYSLAPRTTMFKPEMNKKKLFNMSDQRKFKSENLKVSVSKVLKSECDTKRGPPFEFSDTFQVNHHQTTAVFSLRFSDDGAMLGCALSNKCALAIKSPYSKQISTSYIGHNNVLNSVYWSNDSSYLLTSSNDKTAFLWDRAGGDPLMKITHQKSNLKETESLKKSLKAPQTSGAISRNMLSSNLHSSSSTSLALLDNKPFTKEIKHAQLFYIDKFILLTHGPELALYKFYITHEQDDIKRYQSRNRYKIVSTWQTSSSSFTSTAAVNSFFSYLVLCATTGRSIEVYDLNKSSLAHTFKDCHSRPAHYIAINEGSCFASQPPDAHNVIATIAHTEPIKLWDIRSKSSVQALQGHLNNAHACQISFSPCGNYLASGSEDKHVYVFDLRAGTYCERLRGHSEVVTSVAFHPSKPLLASGSLDGKVLFFKSK